MRQWSGQRHHDGRLRGAHVAQWAARRQVVGMPLSKRRSRARQIWTVAPSGSDRMYADLQ
eukprot:scaffold206878_cov37-Tisochrysis_lutea.AAC.3